MAHNSYAFYSLRLTSSFGRGSLSPAHFSEVAMQNPEFKKNKATNPLLLRVASCQELKKNPSNSTNNHVSS